MLEGILSLACSLGCCLFVAVGLAGIAFMVLRQNKGSGTTDAEGTSGFSSSGPSLSADLQSPVGAAMPPPAPVNHDDAVADDAFGASALGNHVHDHGGFDDDDDMATVVAPPPPGLMNAQIPAASPPPPPKGEPVGRVDDLTDEAPAPPRPSMPSLSDAPLPPKKPETPVSAPQRKAPPPPRSSGQTIIAFDDDEEEDDY